MRPALACLVGSLAQSPSPLQRARSRAEARRSPARRPSGRETVDTLTDQTVSGTDGSEKTGCWKDFEYWRLPLTAGDAVSITGRGNGASGFLVGVFPASTTDANIRTTARSPTARCRTAARCSSGELDRDVRRQVGPNCHDGDDGRVQLHGHGHPQRGQAEGRRAARPVARLPVSGVVTAVSARAGQTAIHDPKLVLKLVGTWKDARPGPRPSTARDGRSQGGRGAVQVPLPSS